MSAILTILLRGDDGEAYNASNDNTYCSIYEMAKLVAKECGQNLIKVVVQDEDTNRYGYAHILKMNLDTSKLKNLGWAQHLI